MSSRHCRSSISNLSHLLTKFITPPMSCDHLTPFSLSETNCRHVLNYHLSTNNPQFFISPKVTHAFPEAKQPPCHTLQGLEDQYLHSLPPSRFDPHPFHCKVSRRTNSVGMPTPAPAALTPTFLTSKRKRWCKEDS